MKLHPISLFLLLALGALSASAQALTGDWSGRLDAGQARLSLTFHFTLHEGRYTGSMDSPDQGAYGIEADSVVTDWPVAPVSPVVPVEPVVPDSTSVETSTMP